MDARSRAIDVCLVTDRVAFDMYPNDDGGDIESGPGSGNRRLRAEVNK